MTDNIEYDAQIAEHTTRRRIYLMRHAEVDYYSEAGLRVHPDMVSITENGQRMCEAAGKLLAGIPIDRVITSGLTRTEVTAKLVLAAAGTEVDRWEVEPGLRELAGGNPALISDLDLPESFLRLWRGQADHDDSYLAGERVGDMIHRAVPAFDRLRNQDDWTTILIVAHGGVNRALLSYAITGQLVFLGHLEQSPACINIIDLDPSTLVRAMNITPYDLTHADNRTWDIERMLLRYQQTLANRDS